MKGKKEEKTTTLMMLKKRRRGVKEEKKKADNKTDNTGGLEAGLRRSIPKAFTEPQNGGLVHPVGAD